MFRLYICFENYGRICVVIWQTSNIIIQDTSSIWFTLFINKMQWSNIGCFYTVCCFNDLCLIPKQVMPLSLYYSCYEIILIKTVLIKQTNCVINENLLVEFRFIALSMSRFDCIFWKSDSSSEINSTRKITIFHGFSANAH